MNFKKILVGISMILASAAAFAKPNTVTVSGNFVNYTFSNRVVAEVIPKNVSDNAYIQINGQPIPPGVGSVTTSPIDPGAGASYSIEVSSLNNDVTMLLIDQNAQQECIWVVKAKTMAPPAPPEGRTNPSICVLSNMYDFVMQTKTNKQ